MKPDARTTRWLGVAFLAQFVTSVAGAVLSAKVVAGGASEALLAAANNLTALRAAGLMELLTKPSMGGSRTTVVTAPPREILRSALFWLSVT